jgi:formate hydrogenlyase transcriptional activator
MQNKTSTKSIFDGIIGTSPALQRVLREAEIVGPTNSTVLILGETGTGKELIARALHDMSPRSSCPFIKVNCAAIPTGLLESELFGHERGSFTGAVVQRIGRFELANNGTIFLDESGDIPLELQPKLLRVLQEREFERLGSSTTLRSNARLIAATHRDLATMVKEKTFREDLYYRLKVFPIHIPPLRERTEDIPELVRHFMNQYSGHMNKDVAYVPDETMDALMGHPWPGNIRELQNFIERAVILSPRSVLCAPIAELEHSNAHLQRNTVINTLAEVQRDHIVQALEASQWVIGGQRGAAERLGMKRTSLIYRMQKLGISREKARCAGA